MEVITKLKECPKITSITVTQEKQLQLKWSKVNGAEKYSVKRALSDKGEFEHIAWVKECVYIDTDVSPDVTCRYKIMAYKKLEGKKTSTKLSPVRAAVVSDIPAPADFQAEENNGKILLTWKAVADAQGYIVSRRNDFYSQILPVARTNKCSFTDEKIVSGQPYHYSVQAFLKGDAGERQGNFSPEAHCVSLDSGEILEAKASFGKKISIRVRLVAGADGYILQKSETKEGPFADSVKTESGIDVALEDKAEKRLRNYYYRVVAYKNVNGKEHRSAPTKTVQLKSR
ncbi:MAG: hypothetical protein IJ491_08280 [Clostridia bacterium]|nr:hypothetical protein [Clostridia bacterium]